MRSSAMSTSSSRATNRSSSTPGSALNAAEVVRKVDEVVGVENLRWLVCSHSDPDIISALPTLVARGLHPDAAIVTHWRDRALIRHLGVDLPYWLVEENGWRLQLEDRSLRFLFTPYAHFAGAFCSFDEASGTLFSSDLFGGFSQDDDRLFADPLDVLFRADARLPRALHAERGDPRPRSSRRSANCRCAALHPSTAW